jgi:glyoxylase-like metal-dependent hydrolase (beta-lactamase superfamily II)
LKWKYQSSPTCSQEDAGRVVIDPRSEESSERSPAQDHVQYIVNTHGHVDHVMGNEEMKRKTGAKIVLTERAGPDES